MEWLLNRSCLRMGLFYYLDEELIEEFSPQEMYLNLLTNTVKVDRIDSNLKVVVDTLWGTARDYLDKFFIERGCTVDVIHNFRDPYFGGTDPKQAKKTSRNLDRSWFPRVMILASQPMETQTALASSIRMELLFHQTIRWRFCSIT